MVRKPVVCGSFYASDFKKLEEQIKSCFLSELGPKSLPTARGKQVIKGAIIPHAGYVYSGCAAAHVYKALGEAQFPDVYVIIGPNHTGMGYNSMLFENMETPFGTVNTDLEFAKRLDQLTELKNDTLAHLKEHSIEVHLPFLQFIAKDRLKDLKIVAIVIHEDMRRLGPMIQQVAREQKKTVCVIASSDFIHHGRYYGYSPFSDDIGNNIKASDDSAFKFIKKKDSEGFMKYIHKNKATICGANPIALLMESVDYKSAELLVHYCSADISGDFENCVDYMGIVLK